jgi:GH15 family glucan-1,4-alpha-glucosidase
MARTVILGNSGLTVGLDESGLVHDFYYPYVGLENLTTARSKPHHIGVWVDGQFSWIHETEWQSDISFNDDALVSNITITHEKLQIGMHFQDFVDVNHDIFARKVRVRNLSNSTRDIRLFFHQVFQISALGRADTAMYIPDGHYILDYKGRCSILAYAETEDGKPFDQYAVGNAGIEGKEGTFRDAEDGELSKSAVEHASVDSTLRVSLNLEPGNSKVVHYWLVVGDAQSSLEKQHAVMLDGGFDKRLEATLTHWHDWLQIAENKLQSVNEEYRRYIKKSLMVIKSHTDEHGGIIASCDSSIYNYGRDYYSYVWPRDGAYIMWPLIKLGYTKEPKAFFEFCRSIMHQDGYLMHKYQPDRAIGSTWHPLLHNNRKELAIQEDETAVVLCMLGEYELYSGDTEFIDKMYDALVYPAANFMSGFIDDITMLPHASYDLWEEKFLVNTYTTAVTYRALVTASDIARARNKLQDAEHWLAAADLLLSRSYAFFNEDRGAFNKGFLLKDDDLYIDTTLDVSSFYGSYLFGYYADEKHIESTLKVLENELLDISPSGGIARYEHDMYFKSDLGYKGNPWFVTTLWLAQYYAKHQQIHKATAYIDWAVSKGLKSGLLSEQISPEDSKIVGVTPLVWSHAELINTILDVIDQS